MREREANLIRERAAELESKCNTKISLGLAAQSLIQLASRCPVKLLNLHPGTRYPNSDGVACQQSTSRLMGAGSGKAPREQSNYWGRSECHMPGMAEAGTGIILCRSHPQPGTVSGQKGPLFCAYTYAAT